MTCEKLLTGLVPSETELSLLLEDLGGPAWGETCLSQKLQGRLQQAYPIYLKLIGNLDSLLKFLKKRIGLDNQGKLAWLDAKTHKKQWKKFVLCLNGNEHDVILKRMNKVNDNLHSLTRDTLDLEPHRVCRKQSNDTFKSVRDHAASLHKSLQGGWSCNCNIPHCADLRLEKRSKKEPLCFSISFSLPTRVVQDPISFLRQKTEIRPIESVDDPISQQNQNLSIVLNQAFPENSSKTALTAMTSIGVRLGAVTEIPQRKSSSSTNVKLSGKRKSIASKIDAQSNTGQSCSTTVTVPERINNLCSALGAADRPHPDVAVGCLVHETQRYSLHAIAKPCALSPKDIISLYDVLRHGQQTGNEYKAAQLLPQWSRKYRLQLAVILASTVLQLHTTPWLNEQWGGEHILFRHGSTEAPYVSKIFSSQDAEQTESASSSHPSPIRNKSIFCLGVLLLELSRNKPLKYFITENDPPQFTDFWVARRVVEGLGDEEGINYLSATRACINCDFGGRISKLSLDNDEFRQAVYKDVIVPLEEELEFFCNQKRQCP
ncbi:MAG: hypothetical protein Q9167_003448 [Letrouitia subvulpina]